jgi:hypothetical protein
MSTPLPPELRAVPRRRLAARPAAARVEPAPGAAARTARRSAPGDLPPIERLPRDGGPLPASSYQQWAWESLRGRVSADLNLPFAVRFAIPLALPALVAGWRELERRHEALRTRFVRAEGEPWTVRQVIDPPGGLELPLVDLSPLPPERREGELGRLATEEAARPLELAAKPMIRVRLVRLDGADHTVLVNLGHLIGDGWSIEILRGELAVLYTAFAAGRPSPLPEPALQLADFAGWQRRIETSAAVERQLAYWRERLARAPAPLLLPGDWPCRPRPGEGTVKAGCLFSPAATARLRALARAEGATVAMTVLAAFGLLLAAYTGETDVLIEATVLGRRAELASVVGFFMSMLPHRLDLSGPPGFAEALRRTRDGVAEDYCNQDLPYPELMRELFPGRRYLSRLAFNMLSLPNPPSLAAWDREREVFSHEGRRPDQQAPKYDLVVLAQEDRDHLRLVLVGAATRFHGETVAEMAADLEELIARALDEPGAPAARLLPAPRYRYARSPEL